MRGALVESVEIGDVIPAGGLRHDGHDEEREQGHERIRGEVENDGGASEGRTDGNNAEEQVAGVADTRISEEAFEVGLREGGKVAEDHGRAGDDGEEREDFFLQGGDDEEGLHHAEKDDKSGGLRRNREEGGDRGGCALVDVGDPELERGGGDFETEGDEDESEAKKQRGCCGLVEDGEFFRDGGEVELSGHAVDPRDAVDEEAGGERAEDEILRAGLKAGFAAAQVGDEDVESDRHEFERDKDHDEVDGGGHPHESGAGENGENVEFAESGAATFGGHVGFDGRRVFEGHDEHDDGRKEGELFKKDRERIRAVEPRVGCGGVHGRGVDEERGAEDTEESGDAGVDDAAFGAGAVEGFGEEQDDAEQDNENFEVKRVHQDRAAKTGLR